jgi:hypothetical protein
VFNISKAEFEKFESEIIGGLYNLWLAKPDFSYLQIAIDEHKLRVEHFRVYRHFYEEVMKLPPFIQAKPKDLSPEISGWASRLENGIWAGQYVQKLVEWNGEIEAGISRYSED